MKVIYLLAGYGFSLLRVVFGLMWFKSGYAKISGGFGVESLVPVVAANADSPVWYKHFFAQVVGPYANVFDLVIPIGELLIGVGLVLGLLAVPAIVMSVFVNVNYILADMIFTYPAEIMLAVILLVGHKFSTAVSIERWLYPKWKNRRLDTGM
ncbi:DoxX family membrane protein [Paenibacillus physcomitrellae]|uniref:DoxX family protein n=1 Tax=Paenibacillus physcomitrellae TaxID=1619311 RepID=A0ABQ1GRW0_9BACL|nr:DoxX family membrane protein [Paenibacillus physcomitrellae]GGA48822.1 hypothetical protein GCM10010917_37620 [Paenibacillus physcomitrellae]